MPWALQPLEHPQDLVAGTRIEIARRFVGQQQCRAIDQGPGDGDSLLLAAGHLRRLVVHARASPTCLSSVSAKCRASLRGDRRRA